MSLEKVYPWKPDAWKVSISSDCSVFELTISLAWSTRAQKYLMMHQKSSTDFPTMSSQFSFIPFLYEIVGDSNNSTAHWAFYYTMVHKKSKNLKNGHFLQSRTKIVLIKIKFAKFWHIGGWCAPVCLIDTLKNLGFL